jgi:hypothetical protein
MAAAANIIIIIISLREDICDLPDFLFSTRPFHRAGLEPAPRLRR